MDGALRLCCDTAKKKNINNKLSDGIQSKSQSNTESDIHVISVMLSLKLRLLSDHKYFIKINQRLAKTPANDGFERYTVALHNIVSFLSSARYQLAQ